MNFIGLCTRKHLIFRDFHIHILSTPPPPPTCKAGIIYSQALQYRRIISNDDDLDVHLQQLSIILIKRGYNICLITKLFSKVHSLSRDDLLQPHSQASCDKLPFIIPFNLDTARIGRYYMSIAKSFKKTTTCTT